MILTETYEVGQGHFSSSLNKKDFPKISSLPSLFSGHFHLGLVIRNVIVSLTLNIIPFSWRTKNIVFYGIKRILLRAPWWHWLSSWSNSADDIKWLSWCLRVLPLFKRNWVKIISFKTSHNLQTCSLAISEKLRGKHLELSSNLTAICLHQNFHSWYHLKVLIMVMNIVHRSLAFVQSQYGIHCHPPSPTYSLSITTVHVVGPCFNCTSCLGMSYEDFHQCNGIVHPRGVKMAHFDDVMRAYRVTPITPSALDITS